MDIQKVVGIMNQIKEIPILNDREVKSGNFTALDNRNSVHYIIYPLLSFLGYNVFNPAEVKVNDGKDITVLESENKLIRINLVDFKDVDKIDNIAFNENESNIKLQIWTTGIHYSLYSNKENIVNFDIRELDKVNIELVLKILLKESLVNSINNDKFFKELLIESKFGNLRSSDYVKEALEKELTNPSRELINLLVDSIYNKYCEKMDKGILRDRLTDELNINHGGLLEAINKEKSSEDTIREVPKTTEFKPEDKKVDPYLSLDSIEEFTKEEVTEEEVTLEDNEKDNEEFTTETSDGLDGIFEEDDEDDLKNMLKGF